MTPPVYIERLIVEEGFLSGLDLRFQPGLNVLVGPRGVGKTTVIQLLRYCLGVSAPTERSQVSALHHARAVLGEDGRVSVAVRVDGEQIVVSRRRRDDEPEGEVDAFPGPIVLAQAEIEEVGVSPVGRLRLIDDFRRSLAKEADLERALLSSVQSLTRELSDLGRGIADQRARIVGLEEARQQLLSAEAEVGEAQRTATQATSDFVRLDELGRSSANGQVRLDVLARSTEGLEAFASSLETARRRIPSFEPWPGDENVDPLAPIRSRLSATEATLSDVAASIAQCLDDLMEAAAQERHGLRVVDNEARDVRRRVEELQAGAGAASRRLAALRERVAQLESLSEVIEERERRRELVRAARDDTLVQLDRFRESRFASRLEISEALNGALRPQIETAVTRSGLWESYAEAISETLRGKGLRITEVASRIAASFGPTELAEVVEGEDSARLARCADIQEDRARRIIDRFREVGLGGVLGAELEDAVRLRLLDGSDYKLTEDLSTGQRCTAVLPVILQHEDRPVVVDQPEDHLDGGFIVQTLVRAILARAPQSQLIVSTHNPNIPVLGDAAQVTLLGSDGRRGHELHTGGLDDPVIVDSITTIMEGGREAFERRAAFYDGRTP